MQRRHLHLLILVALWTLLYGSALCNPPVLDDADATHAQAARAMLTTGDWVTLHVDGIRYLEKPPLPYWLVAICFRLFGFNTFATHLPIALSVLGLALLAYAWSRQAFGDEAAMLAGVMTLTTLGVFLFTRILIPEALLSFFLLLALFSFLKALHSTATPSPPATTTPDAPPSAHSLRLGWAYPYLMWTSLALAVLTKGLVALVFFFVPVTLFLLLTQNPRRNLSSRPERSGAERSLHLFFENLRSLKPFTGTLLLFAIAAPWHILAGLRNTGGANGHGFFWFYFINEHLLRFLGRREPHDYNKLPWMLYWPLHIIWLLPWSFFAPLALLRINSRAKLRGLFRSSSFTARTVLLLTLFSAIVLVFFSISTNQEYYTFPAYIPLLLLIAHGISLAQQQFSSDPVARRIFTAAHATFAIGSLIAAGALAYGLWSARSIHSTTDIGSLLAHRGVGDYTLSLSRFFDLTGPSFAALRLPATLALLALAIGPLAAWLLRTKARHTPANAAIVATASIFLLAAHIALVRFTPMLSSQDFIATMQQLSTAHRTAPDTQVLLFGDQSYGSSIPFYLGRPVFLVDGRSTSMLFGSTFPDTPHLFLTPQQLAAQWGSGPRKLLFVPAERRADADRLLGTRAILLRESSGKALFTDRPLDAATSTHD